MSDTVLAHPSSHVGQVRVQTSSYAEPRVACPKPKLECYSCKTSQVPLMGLIISHKAPPSQVRRKWPRLVSGKRVQEAVWSMAAEADSSGAEALGQGEAVPLASSLSDVQLVEAFFDAEQRLGSAAAAAAHPAAAPQVSHNHQLAVAKLPG